MSQKQGSNGSYCASLVSLINVSVPGGQAPESKNTLPTLLNQSSKSREWLVEQSLNSTLSLVV